jgi:hypothetical protein
MSRHLRDSLDIDLFKIPSVVRIIRYSNTWKCKLFHLNIPNYKRQRSLIGKLMRSGPIKADHLYTTSSYRRFDQWLGLLAFSGRLEYFVWRTTRWSRCSRKKLHRDKIPDILRFHRKNSQSRNVSSHLNI